VDVFIGNVPALENVKTYPNPAVLGSGRNSYMLFNNVPSGSELQLFTISGKHVCTLHEADFGGDNIIKWDGKNRDGVYISQGIYLYLIKDGAGNKRTGKVAVKRD